MKKDTTMTKVVFVTKISRMGDRKMIIIPKDYHQDVEIFKRQVKITLDDEL
jgi:hypothetical protein